MTGYELSEKLRKTRRRCRLSATSQALWHELVAICNEEGWPGMFKCSNSELSGALNIDEKTLILKRQELTQSGLLSYRSGKSKKAIGEYSLWNDLTTGKFPVNPPANVPAQTPANVPAQTPAKPPDLYIGKTETKLTKTISVGKPPAEEKKEVTDFWGKLVDEWFSFYAGHFKDAVGQPAKPKFEAVEGAQLKKIVSHLKTLAKNQKKEWTEDYSVYCLHGFLLKAIHHDAWIKNNFELANLLSKFNSITNSTLEQQNGSFQKTVKGSASKITGAVDFSRGF